jgi:transcription elongation factor Elf1
MYWLDNKYILLVSSRLQHFKQKSTRLFNFRCPFCGDSQRNKSKARGYLYEKKGDTRYICHNCSHSCGFPAFLRSQDLQLYNEYKLDLIKDKRVTEPTEVSVFEEKLKPVFTSKLLKGLKKISQLDSSDPLKQYVVNREIPPEYHYLLYSCPDFMHFVNNIIPEKFNEATLKYDETRLLIPFFNSAKQLLAFQGRSLKIDSPNRYVFITLQQDVPILFGLERVNLKKRFYVLEGPLDALFINNSLASGGGDIVAALHKLDFEKENAVIVYDNERRSQETIHKIDKAIDSGYNVVIWDHNGSKDVNLMIQNGVDVDLPRLTFSGLKAKAKLAEWSKY